MSRTLRTELDLNIAAKVANSSEPANGASWETIQFLAGKLY